MPATKAHVVSIEDVIADINTILDIAQRSNTQAMELNLRLLDSMMAAIAEGDENPWLLAQTYMKYMFDDTSEEEVDNEVEM